MADEVYIGNADSQRNGTVRLVVDDAAGTAEVQRRINGLYTPLGGTASGEAAAIAARTQAITEAGAIDLDAQVVQITGPESSTYAVTLAAPTRAGIVKIIEMVGTTSTNAVTLALTNVVGGSAASSASFNAADELLVLISSATAWVVLKEVGVTLS